jgi:uncharacterized repeat protein (TIGR02543 family)
VAPEDSEAANPCPSDYPIWVQEPGMNGTSFCIDNKRVYSLMPAGCYKPTSNCKPPGETGGNGWVTYKAPTPTTKYTLKYTAGTGGTISGTATQSIEKGKSGSQVTAVPNDGYTFTKWSDNKTSASRTDSNVQGNITVTANFAIKKYTVTYSPNGGSCTPATIEINHGSNAAAPSCTRSTYNVAGFTRTSGSGGDLNTSTGAVTNVSGNQTIQVSWSKSCGDGTCTADENANSCPVDCTAECGDSYCTHDENAATCSNDCEVNCGDGYCTHNENAETCSADCNTDCGDGLCTGEETPLTCSADCESECGDDLCTQGEDSNNCSKDCGEPVVQADTIPQTGIFDTVLGRVSVGVSFIFLGGLVSQYSKFNYLFNSITEKQEFRREIRKQKRVAKRRGRLEDRFK